IAREGAEAPFARADLPSQHLDMVDFSRSTMPESPSIILPCLKEPGWAGQGDLCRPLWDGIESAHMPWLAFGYDRPNTIEFLSRAKLEELKKTERDIEREAIRNLRLRKASWHPTQAKLGFLKKLKMLICGDDYFAAEKILDPGF